MHIPDDELIKRGIAERQEDGALLITDTDAFMQQPEMQFPLILAETYKEFCQYPDDIILPQEEVNDLVLLFKTWTEENITPPVEHAAVQKNYWLLGISDADGTLNPDQLKKAILFMLEQKDEPADFEKLLAFMQGVEIKPLTRQQRRQAEREKRKSK